MTLKSNTLKLSPLLAQYLFLHKKLSLAGIGTFLIEPGPVESPNEEKKDSAVHIRFLYDSTVKEDKNLVDFISSQTGKMKSLAASDLDSHLELARQFLNIGKPFLIEGIGVLTKNKNEKLDFVPDYISDENNNEHSDTDTEHPSLTEESFTDYEDMLSPKQRAVPFSRKLVLWLAILTGIGLAVWGGYLIYNKTNKPSNKIINEPTNVLVSDTGAYAAPDSSTKQVLTTTLPPNYYKFIIETADSNRAFTRFNDLKNYGLDIRMETTDSTSFKLYFLLAATPADTSRIRDSLTVWYGTRSKTRIEN